MKKGTLLLQTKFTLTAYNGMRTLESVMYLEAHDFYKDLCIDIINRRTDLIKTKGEIILPKIFLSPSTQEWNKYATEGNEELYMNLLADRMEPYLRSSGIAFDRNDPDRNVQGAIQDSNAGQYLSLIHISEPTRP